MIDEKKLLSGGPFPEGKIHGQTHRFTVKCSLYGIAIMRKCIVSRREYFFATKKSDNLEERGALRGEKGKAFP